MFCLGLKLLPRGKHPFDRDVVPRWAPTLFTASAWLRLQSFSAGIAGAFAPMVFAITHRAEVACHLAHLPEPPNHREGMAGRGKKPKNKPACG